MTLTKDFGRRARTAIHLGVGNILRVADYRFRLAAGIHPVQHLRPRQIRREPFFGSPAESRSNDDAVEPPRLCDFGWFERAPATSPPDWFTSPIDERAHSSAVQQWWKIPDFSSAGGDVKALWEASRFDWVVALAIASRRNDRVRMVLNEWLSDWVAKNPSYLGPNWKCGQEASIRVIHLATAAQISSPSSMSASLGDLIWNHLRRIEPSMAYAVGQDNNHGISEAAALFIGGHWLARAGFGDGGRWAQIGRHWLENRVNRLFLSDGTFSQYSTNYHRLALETLSISELWRRKFDEPSFSATFRSKAAAAARWLCAMIDLESGDVPNIGANDGAYLLGATGPSYRDYRPAARLAMALFCGKSCFPGEGDRPELERAFDVPHSVTGCPPLTDELFDDGGFAVLRRPRSMVVVRYPRFHFRPSDADALHVDLWHHGRNLLRDAGTFSYAAEPALRDYFSGVTGHNTTQFDGRDQMPRLGRFLWGNWLETTERSSITTSHDSATFNAGYRDEAGSAHHRSVTLSDEAVTIVDRVSGFHKSAVFRWRLAPDDWKLANGAVTSSAGALIVTSSARFSRFEIINGYESRYYLQRTACPILEVEVTEPAELTSTYLLPG